MGLLGPYVRVVLKVLSSKTKSCFTAWTSEGSIPAAESEGNAKAEELISVMNVKQAMASSKTLQVRGVSICLDKLRPDEGHTPLPH